LILRLLRPGNSSLAAAAMLAACSRAATVYPPPAPAIALAESAYADLRVLRDRYDITTASGRTATTDGEPLAALAARHDTLRIAVASRLASLDSTGMGQEDARALGTMRATLAGDLGPLGASPADSPTAELQPDCAYDAVAIAGAQRGLDSLRKRIYDCYGWAQHRIVVGADTLDRLTILGKIGREADAHRRQSLFLALVPVWQSMNGDNQAGSPYRALIALEVRRRATQEPLAVSQARASGLPADSLEPWLRRMLEAWRDATPDSLLEPWDWLYAAGKASRALSPRISAARLEALDADVYRALGADVSALRVHYDLAPRDGKTPVAYTTFGGRARLRGKRWVPAEPWIFATYREGGLDNLIELLHETGHAIHIAAIRTRPAFADWPDSDPFSEALGDFVALDFAEPKWQQRWLGDSVPLADGLRARYAGIVLDVAWALFETQMLRDPTLDPNTVWTRLTRDYLHIRPHPELSWWAMRGQLIDAPGYMMNYAAGAILIAAIRARTVEQHGSFVTGNPSWYAWVAPRLFRFGLERPSRDVIEGYLGGPVTPTAILQDMRRMQTDPRARR
jgi:hypothetical protein